MLPNHETFKFSDSQQSNAQFTFSYASVIYSFMLINSTNSEKETPPLQQPHKRSLSQKPVCPELYCSSFLAKHLPTNLFITHCPSNDYDSGPGHRLTEV